MKYYKQLYNGIIVSIGTNKAGEEITEAEYTELMAIIQNAPRSEGKGYKLRADLTWEEYDLPPEPEPSDEDEISTDEALNILLGGAT